MKKFQKIMKILFLTLFGLFVMYLAWILIYNIDYSDSSFKRDHYKWRLERIEYQRCLCEFYNNKIFLGLLLNMIVQ